MAMMISKFHKLIQSKTVWYLFLGLVVIAFVLVYIPGFGRGSTSRAQKQAQHAGKLFGEKISHAEFRQAYRNVRFQFAMYYMQQGGGIPQDQETEDRMTETAWQQLAIMKKAERSGISVTEKEAADALSKDPMFFGENGKFDPNTYQLMVINFLPRLGFNESMLAAYYNQQVLIQKMSRIPEQAALVTDKELTSAFHLYFDKRTVEFTAVPRSFCAPVEVTEEMAKAYFESNASKFRIPEKVSIDYVQYKVEDFIGDVDIDEETIAAVYEANKQRYVKEPAEDAAIDAEPEYTPLEEVKEELRTAITQSRAQKLALDKADDFVGALSRTDANFEETAKKLNVSVVKGTAPFSSTDSVPGIDPTSAFVDIAMTLSDDEINFYSDPIVGTKTVYIIKLNKRIPAQNPTFEVVKEAATEAARVDAEEKEYMATAERIRTTIQTAINAGTSFTNATTEQKLTLQTTEPFNVMVAPEGDFGRDIQLATRYTPKGQLCALVITPTEHLIAYVAEITPANEETELPIEIEGLRNELTYRKVSALRNSWRKAILKEAKLESFLTPAEEETEDNA